MTLIHTDTAVRDFASWASTVDPWYCVLTVLVVLSAETSLLLGMILPGDAVLLLAVGVLGSHWTLPLFLAAVLANVIGQTGGYWLGRAIGPGLRTTWLGRKVGERRWRAAESVLHGSGARALITTRFVAFVHAVVPVLVGTLRLPFGRFLGLATIGASLWATALTGMAVVLGETARTVGYGWGFTAFACLGGGIAVVLIIRAVRNRSARNSHEATSI
ncbi:membrane protein DedA with SNARE-associated domain [Saccharopolyspora lacisalsi]|uniref:Membrane protein DedA with SNARE-associated domain n=1 Tax=Halosaccharopolyspora lacisalsi TaxID=1000566 RepID=A0A839DTJ5_9PSEU|nr:DedA family protein [Halosaccharopolyspora lacisalsi]MBA8822717.1 membrane protein DedA with SNARE-associated domain [Halosaccharopolyspora lacisalsi]